jgi:hypothetical protein
LTGKLKREEIQQSVAQIARQTECWLSRREV